MLRKRKDTAMAVTKRTRFEVFRRDQHTCQYCGGKAPDVTLHVDHVEPKALGGADAPDNLVTACKDCNVGKSSIMPDSPLVQNLSERAAAYALGMIDKMTKLRQSINDLEAYQEEFEESWNGWTSKPANTRIPLPPDYEMSLFRWHRMGVPMRLIEMAIAKAMSNPKLYGDFPEFAYMAGIVWKVLQEDEIDYTVTVDTAAVFTEWEADNMRVEGYEMGVIQGRETERNHASVRDWLQHHIDQTEPVFAGDGEFRYVTGKVQKRAA